MPIVISAGSASRVPWALRTEMPDDRRHTIDRWEQGLSRTGVRSTSDAALSSFERAAHNYRAEVN